MAESEEELKSLLMEVKVESEKVMSQFHGMWCIDFSFALFTSN